MRTLTAAFLAVVACATSVSAEGDACAVAAHLVQADGGLPRVAAAIAKTHALTIAVAGTTSSSLPGANGATLAYPARLQVALQKKLPDVAVKVVPYVTPRTTAASQAVAFPGILKADHPALVIWQTGTYDAMQGIATDPFQTTLERGIETLHQGGADVIFVNMQYSPRTDVVLAWQPYAEAIRWAAIGAGLNVFDRHAVMRHWSELGSFDLTAVTKSLDTASQVHDCIGRLLAGLIAEATKMSEAESKEIK